MYRLILRMDIAELDARQQERQDNQQIRREHRAPESRAPRINTERQFALA